MAKYDYVGTWDHKVSRDASVPDSNVKESFFRGVRVGQKIIPACLISSVVVFAMCSEVLCFSTFANYLAQETCEKLRKYINLNKTFSLRESNLVPGTV